MSGLFFRGLNGLEHLFSSNILFDVSWIFIFSSLNDYHTDANDFLAKMVGSIFPDVHIIVPALLDMDAASDVELPSSSSIISSHRLPTFPFGLNARFCLLIYYNRCIVCFSSKVFIFLLGGGDTPTK